MSSPDATREYSENNGRELDLDDMTEDVMESASYHLNKAIEIAETLKVQVADLREQLKEFNKSAILWK